MWLRSPQTNAQARAGDLRRASCHIDDLGDLLAAFAAFDQILDLLDALRRELDRSSVGSIRNLNDGHSRTHTGAAIRLIAPTVLARFAPRAGVSQENLAGVQLPLTGATLTHARSRRDVGFVSFCIVLYRRGLRATREPSDATARTQADEGVIGNDQH